MKTNWRSMFRKTKWSLPAFSLLILLAAAENTAPEIKVLADDKRTIEMVSNGGSSEGELRILRLGTTFPEGSTGESLVFIVRDPKSGLYSWTHQWLEPKAPSYRRDHGQAFIVKNKFYLAKDKIVGFHLSGYDLIVNEDGGKEKEPQTAREDVIAVLKTRINKAHAYPAQSLMAISLKKSLGLSFFMGSKLTANLRESKLLGISHAGQDWTINLEGPDGEHATVVLSSDYKIQKAERSGKALFHDDDGERR